MRYFIALLFATVALRGEIEFSGFFITQNEELFSLTDRADQRSSGWLKLGESFRGYTVVSFNAKNEIITLEHDGRVTRVPLRASKVKDGRATIGGALRFSGERINGVRTVLFMGEESVFPLRHGVTFRIKPEALADGTIRYHAKFVSRNKEGGETVHSTPSVIAAAGQPFGIQVGEFGYSFAP